MVVAAADVKKGDVIASYAPDDDESAFWLGRCDADGEFAGEPNDARGGEARRASDAASAATRPVERKGREETRGGVRGRSRARVGSAVARRPDLADRLVLNDEGESRRDELQQSGRKKFRTLFEVSSSGGGRCGLRASIEVTTAGGRLSSASSGRGPRRRRSKQQHCRR